MQARKTISIFKFCFLLFLSAVHFNGYSQLRPSFSVNQSNQCFKNNAYTFINTSLNQPFNNIKWDLGDGNFAYSDTIVHTYTKPGNYNVTLIASSNGVDYYTSSIVSVYAIPEVSFSVLANTQNGSSYTFLSTASISEGNMNYLWDFGDGTQSTLINPLKNYFSAGDYIVKLLVKSNNGCTDSSQQIIHVTIDGKSFSAAFNANSYIQCLQNNQFVFNNLSTKGNHFRYKWDFGDSTQSTAINPTKTYTKAGQFAVTLTAYNPSNDSLQVVQYINVQASPKADFVFTGKSITDTTIQFISTSTTDLGQLRQVWAFGDNTQSELINPLKTYRQPGNFNAQLKVTNAITGCTDSIQKLVLICPYIKASFKVEAKNVCANNNAYNFFATNSSNSKLDPNTVITAWSFGNGKKANGDSATTFYGTDGTYFVKMVSGYTDKACSVTDSVTLPVIVYPTPKAKYVLYLDTKLVTTDTVYQCYSNGSDFSFVNNSSVASGIMQYNWTFGNTAYTLREGNTNTSNIRLQFKEAASFVARLTAISDKGCRDSIDRVINLSAPIANFSTNINFGGKASNNPFVSFTSTSKDLGGSITKALWNYSDGNTTRTAQGTTVGPVQFTRGGRISTTLTITSNSGCSASITKDTSFYIQPIALFTAKPFYIDANGKSVVAIAANNSTIAETPVNLQYAWDFGDSTLISNAIIPEAHIYQNSANRRTITLTVTNVNGGLKSTYALTVATAYIKPTARFTFSRTNAATTAPIVAFDASTSTLNDTTGNLLYDWNFGDGTPKETTAKCTHLFKAGGKYTVTLTVTNSQTLQSGSVSLPVEYYVTPTASFVGNLNYNNNKYSIPVVELNATSSTINDANAQLSYSWNLGNGQTATGINPKITYSTGGVKQITLTVTNANGSTVSTISQNINVVITPKAQIAVNYNPSNSYLTFYGNATAAPSSIAAGSIASYTWTFDYTWIPNGFTYFNWAGTFTQPTVSWVGSFTNWRITARLTVTSDLGVTETITAVYGGTTPSGYTAFRSIDFKPNMIKTEGTPHLLPTGNLKAIRIYPNPCTDHAIINFSSDNSVGNDVEIAIYNISGQKMITQRYKMQHGAMNSAYIETSTLTKGYYRFVIKNLLDETLNEGSFIKQ